MTQKQLAFCMEYTATRNAYQSALKAGYTEGYALKQSFKLLKRKDIQEQIKIFEDEYFTKEFKRLAVKSMRKLDDILSSVEIDRVQLQAVKYALREAGITDTDSEQETQKIEIKIKMPDDL